MSNKGALGSYKHQCFSSFETMKHVRVGDMERPTFEKYLTDRYFPEISWYDKNSMRNQIWYRALQTSLIILSALTPVLIALAQKEGSMPWVKSLSLLTSVLVAILATSLKTFKFEENWLNYRTTCETLKKEIYFLNAGIDEYKDSQDPEGLFVKRVEALISRENTLWLTALENKQTDKSK
jgi:hypothetical protein